MASGEIPLLEFFAIVSMSQHYIEAYTKQKDSMYLLEVFGMTSIRRQFLQELRLPNFVNARVRFQGKLKFPVSVGTSDNSSDFYSLANFEFGYETG